MMKTANALPEMKREIGGVENIRYEEWKEKYPKPVKDVTESAANGAAKRDT